MGDLSEHFDLKEFDCPCCGLNRVDRALVDRLESARRLYGHPIRVVSGTRCAEHNRQVGGAVTSAHLYGKAADIRCVDSGDRYMLLMALLTVGFARIGVARSYLHADIDYTKDQDVCWLYS